MLAQEYFTKDEIVETLKKASLTIVDKTTEENLQKFIEAAKRL